MELSSKHMKKINREDKKYQLAADRFGISASEILHRIKKFYRAEDFINGHEFSSTWMIEKTMIILRDLIH